MKSVRLTTALEARLEQAARITGESESSIIREAIAERCDKLVAATLDHRLADVIGVVSSTGGRARRTGRAFVAALKGRAARRRS